MKAFFLLQAILFSLCIQAQQVIKVSLQASGLTCSMCSNAVNKSLKTIDFVQAIQPDVQTSTFYITFKPGSKVDFYQLKKKVEDAGFSVSKFIVTINFNGVQITPDAPVTVGDKTFQFVGAKPGALNGEMPVKILNKGFVSAKEFKKNAYPGNTNVYYASI